MRRIKVGHLARVEGHGSIDIEVDGKKVRNVRMEILEGPRLFETLTLGKLPEENLSIVPRICAICTLSHKTASVRALEKCLGIRVPEKVGLIRELMMLGESLESNSLHVYLLALPDFLGYPNAIAMVDKYAEVVTQGLELKKFGNRVMEVTSARATHGENPLIGGFGKYPTNDELLAIKYRSKELLPYAYKITEILGKLKFDTYLDVETTFASVNPTGNEYGYISDKIILSDGQEYNVEDYREVTNERVVSHSYAKRARYKEKPFTVGAIARINNLGDRLKGKAGEYYRRYKSKRWLKNPLYNNLAQAIELVYDLECIPGVIDRLVKLKNPKIVRSSRDGGRGTGAVEAPRGTLYHSYEVKKGRMAAVDIITPTAQSLDDIEKYLRIAAEYMLGKNKSDAEVRKECEIVARAYDPCISCSAHLARIIRK